MLSFSVFHWKYCIWEILFPKLKIVCLKQNLVPRLTPMCGIQCCVQKFIYFLYDLQSSDQSINTLGMLYSSYMGMTWKVVNKVVKTTTTEHEASRNP